MTTEATAVREANAARAGARGRGGQEGGTLVLVLVLLLILLVVAAVVIRGAASDVATAGYDRTGKAAFLCAESGLRIGASQLAADNSTYTATLNCGTLDGGAGCGCYGSTTCPLRASNDGGVYVEVWLTDNVDENPNNPSADIDKVVYINSRCLQADLPRRELTVLHGGSGAGQYYKNQAGQGSTNTGNQNVK